MVNALSIDVEDYYQVAAFASSVRIDEWENHERRVEDNTRRIMDLLDEKDTKATFFVLGWVGERHPALVKKIKDRGHEVASHGHMHQRIYNQTREEFREDTRRSKNVLEDLTGEKVLGYRAASCSITSECLWAIDILIELGFEYDSSIFPIKHANYGIPGHERFMHTINGNNGNSGLSIAELPLSTVRIGGVNIPVAGGGYLRLMPYSLTRSAIRHLNSAEKQPAVVYFHPWEIDPAQPRIKAGLKSRLRHYTNISGMEAKLRKLLDDFTFTPLNELVGGLNPQGVAEWTSRS